MEAERRIEKGRSGLKAKLVASKLGVEQGHQEHE